MVEGRRSEVLLETSSCLLESKVWLEIELLRLLLRSESIPNMLCFLFLGVWPKRGLVLLIRGGGLCLMITWLCKDLSEGVEFIPDCFVRFDNLFLEINNEIVDQFALFNKSHDQF